MCIISMRVKVRVRVRVRFRFRFRAKVRARVRVRVRVRRTNMGTISISHLLEAMSTAFESQGLNILEDKGFDQDLSRLIVLPYVLELTLIVKPTDL